MSLAEILFIIIAFLANIIQAITGFAGTVLAMPLSINLVGYSTARPILNMVAIVVCLIVVIVDFKKINWKKLLALLIFVGIGFGIGFLIHSLNVDAKHLLRGYGAVICMIAITFLFVKVDGHSIPKVFKYAILVFAGIIHFLYTSGGPLVILFTASTITDKREFRVTLSALWVFLNSIVFATNIIQGDFTSRVWILSLIVILTSLLSIVIGRFILKKINNDMFMKLTYILLLISGITAVL